jgi:hypothetical protein
MSDLRNLSTLSNENIDLLVEALQVAIIAHDRSILPGDVKRNRERLRLKTRLQVTRLARTRKREQDLFADPRFNTEFLSRPGESRHRYNGKQGDGNDEVSTCSCLGPPCPPGCEGAV